MAYSNVFLDHLYKSTDSVVVTEVSVSVVLGITL